MLLAAGDAIIDLSGRLAAAMPAELREELTPVLAVAALSGEDGDGGARMLARRATTAVGVGGTGAIADLTTELLTRSGLSARAWSPERLADSNAPDLMVLVGYPPPDCLAETLRRRGSRIWRSASARPSA